MTVPRRSPVLHLSIAAFLLAAATAVVLAASLRIEIVATGPATVVPRDRVQVLRGERGGTVVAVEAKAGTLVAEGRAVLRLDATAQEVRLGQARDALADLTARRDGLDALLAGLEDEASPPPAPEDLAARSARIAGSVREAEAFIAAAQGERAVAYARIARIDALLSLENRRLTAVERLRETGVASGERLLDRVEARTDLETLRTIQEAEVAQIDLEVAALATARDGTLARARDEAAAERAALVREIASLRREMRRLTRDVEAATIRAPLAGRLQFEDDLRAGTVVEAGAALARIVPEGAAHDVIVDVSNTDIGFLSAGQSARVRIDAFPFSRYGAVKGRVVRIAADAVQDAPDAPLTYPVLVRLEAGATDLPLRAGMTARVDVVTGARTILSYFFAPIIDVISSGLRER